MSLDKTDPFLWMNEPDQWEVDGAGIHLRTNAKTDFWRKTHYGFIRDNGHFWYIKQSGAFEVSVKFSGQYRELYDQAGIMIRRDAENWTKTGVEYVDGVQQASAVVTRDFSDWSVIPLQDNPPSFWLKARKGGDHVEISYSTDGNRYHLLRLAYFPPSGEVQVGLMAASPDGSGFNVHFEDFRINRI